LIFFIAYLTIHINKLFHIIIVHSSKRKNSLNQLPVVLNSRNSNIRKKTIESHSTPNIKGMLRKMSLNPIDSRNSKDGSTKKFLNYNNFFFFFFFFLNFDIIQQFKLI